MRYAHTFLALALLTGCDLAKTSETSSEPKGEKESSKKASSEKATESDEKEDEKSQQKRAINTTLAFLKAAKKAELDADKLVDHTEETDPNKLLGRPGQYVKKLNWKIDGHDASLEVFPTLKGAKQRAEYLEKINESGIAMVLQYVYLNEDARAVLHIDHEVTPSKAKDWKKLLDEL